MSTGGADSPKTSWHVLVKPRLAQLDSHGRAVLADVHQLGLEHVSEVRSSRIYFFCGNIREDDIRKIAAQLLTDPAAETYQYHENFTHREGNHPAIEVHYKPGVMNPAAGSTHEAALRLLGIDTDEIEEVQTARRYEVLGVQSTAELEEIAARIVANSCIETIYIQGAEGRNDALPEQFRRPPTEAFSIRRVKLAGLTDDELTRLSRDAHLFLSLEEMRTVRDHFVKLDRDPTDLELETLAQTWSEHCVHKTLRSAIDYEGEGFGDKGEVQVHFDNLLKDTIVTATETLDRDWCLSVFEDNAGVISFDDEYGIAVKVETHNHPSAIEPYGGSATGIGGCIRDIMGCGLGARPIASTDVFCVAPPDYDRAKLPKDVLHPRRILKGITRGVRDYGNRMGIPTVNGAVHFHEGYLGNPLVFCGCIGLMPRNRIHKAAQPGDKIVVAGGRTGRDGIHGATFSSAELTDTHADEFSHAVQIGNPVEEKKVLEAMMLARDHSRGCLYSAVTDCGAGGLSSAIGEMGELLGADVELQHVPLKYAGLRYDEIWISEAQERMVFSVPPENLDTLMTLFADEEVEATVLGTFTSDHQLRVRFGGEVVGELDMAFLHKGYPSSTRTARWSQSAKPTASVRPTGNGNANKYLLEELGSFTVASKEWLIRQYDHEVQGRSVVKPIVGPGEGPSDAAVVRPLYDKPGGIAIGCGLCPEKTAVDPYWMAVCAVDEALRNIICVGANPAKTAILDNFCWGKCDTPEGMGELVRTCVGAKDAAIAYGLPFISGKDSLNNEFSQNEEDAKRLGLPAQISIPGTLLVTAVGMIDNVKRCVTMDSKSAGNALVLASAPVDVVGLEAAFAMHSTVASLIRSGEVLSSHDVSDGGLAVALAEMCIASKLGAKIEIDTASYPDSIFAPRQTTYVLEMTPDSASHCGLPRIGTVTEEAQLEISIEGSLLINQPVSALTEAWRTPLAL